jgi:hypothetical protein
MRVYFEVEANEIEKVATATYYNNIMWKFTKPNKLGITYLKEHYDDVNDWPSYELGVLVDGKFKCLGTGEGDPIPEDKIGFGGVFTQIMIRYPEYLFKRK